MQLSAADIKPNVHEKWFLRNHGETDLRKKSISGGIFTVGAQIMSFIVNIGSTVVMARMLLPEDYGIVTMVTSFTGFVLIFKDLGLAQAVIQKETITQREVSMVFWLNFYISIFLGLLVLGLGPLLVSFYKEDRLLYITSAYAGVAILGGLSTQHAALLNRQMKFKSLAIITIISSFISLLVGITLAYLDFGYWAIVSISLVSAFVQAILLWISCDWRPVYLRINKSIKQYVHFGAGVTGFNMINYFSRNLDNILIGKFIGAPALGLYNRAYQLLMLPISQLRDPLNAVGTPALSSLIHQPEKYRNYYKQYLFLLSFFSLPIVVFLFVCSKPIILLVLGPNWTSASLIFQLLAITALIQPIASTRGMILLSSGQSKRYFMWGVWNAAAVIIAFFIGVQWGISGIAIAYAISNYLILVPSLYFCYKNTPVKVSDFFTASLPPFVFSVIGGLAAYGSSLYLQQQHTLLQIIVPFLLFSIVYLAGWMLFPPTRKQLKGLIEMAKGIISKKSKQ
ncbi:MAG: lipopolysaccharide biosynthesis protein [Lacibacter sp.]